MHEVKLPSGALLKVEPAPFMEAKALYTAVLNELKDMEFNSETDMTALFKDILCIAFSSPQIEAALKRCSLRCMIDGFGKVIDDYFEPVEKRDDYMVVCFEILKANITPFVKSLFAGYEKFLAMIPNIPLSK